MAKQDVFSSDYFSMRTLTANINKVPVKPSRISKLGIFEEKGITTTECAIEFQDNKIALLPTTPRGGPAPVYTHAKREAVPFTLPHLITRCTLLADAIQNIRASGKTDTLVITDAIEERLLGMRVNLEATIEYHRMGGIKGVVLDANGSVLFDTFAEFDVIKSTHTLDLSAQGGNLRNQVIAARRKAEKVLGDDAGKVSRWVCLSSSGFFDGLVSHPSMESFFSGWYGASSLRDDVRESFPIGGVHFEEYVGSIGGVNFIEDGKAYLVPVGVPGLFISRFGPADYAETLNTIGVPYYAKSVPMEFDRGAKMEAQSNPINLCTRPDAVVELSI